MVNSEIMLSIICATYNHEKYLPFALDGILSQKTKYTYEVLIGEDCSRDLSGLIIKKYESKYPGKFTVFYREHNYGASRNFDDLYSRAQGKYIIVLETDDYWLDPLKIEKQISFLEHNDDYIAVAHRCVMVGEDNQVLGMEYPECLHRCYTLKDFRKGLLPGQTTSIMYRNIYKNKNNLNTDLITDAKYLVGPGDIRKAFFLVANGKVSCFPQIMSAYRFITKGGSSFSALLKDSNDLIYRKQFVDYAKKARLSKEAIYTAECVYIRQLLLFFVKRKNSVTFSLLFSELSNSSQKVRCFFSTLSYCLSVIIRKPFGLNKTYKKCNRRKMKLIARILPQQER